MSFEPKTKAGKFILDAVNKVDEFIESKTDEPAEKEVAYVIIAKLEQLIKASPTKFDDMLALPLMAFLKNRYKI